MKGNWLDNELKFRLAMLLIDTMADNDGITSSMRDDIRAELLKRFMPPFASLEVSEEELCEKGTQNNKARSDQQK